MPKPPLWIQRRGLKWDELRAELERKGLPVFRLGDRFELTEKGTAAVLGVTVLDDAEVRGLLRPPAPEEDAS